jgi:hypothetical protein
MIKNKAKLEEFERKLLATENLSYKQKLAIYDALFKEAVSLGIFNDDNILDGIEVDIKIAKAINSLNG